MKQRNKGNWHSTLLYIFLCLTMGLTACTAKGNHQIVQEKNAPFYLSQEHLFHEGMVAVETDGWWQYVDRQGNYVPIGKFEEACNFDSYGLARVKLGGKAGYINTKGEQVIPCQYDNAALSFAPNGLASVCKDGKWGYINTKGEEVIPFRYDNAYSFASNGLASVCKDGKWGYINTKGEQEISYQYDWAYKFASNGLAIVALAGKEGYINTKGELVIPCQYDLAYGFTSNGLAMVYDDGVWDHINSKGERVYVLRWDLTEPLNPIEEGRAILLYKDFALFSENGRAKVEENGKYGYIDTCGKLVIPCQYDDAGDFAPNGLTLAITGNVGHMIDASGNVVKEIDVAIDSVSNPYTYDDAYIIKKDGKYGVLSIDGDIILPPIYDNIDF